MRGSRERERERERDREIERDGGGGSPTPGKSQVAIGFLKYCYGPPPLKKQLEPLFFRGVQCITESVGKGVAIGPLGPDASRGRSVRPSVKYVCD